jgi:hypothetical protein
MHHLSTNVHAPTVESVDPELVALPLPPQQERRRTLVLLGVTAAASLAMVFSLRHDARFAFERDVPVELPDLRTVPENALVESSFVHATAHLGAANAIKFERPLSESSYRLMPVAGRPDVWVEVRIPASEENPRFVPPVEFTGQLVRFRGAGPKHRGLTDAIRGTTQQNIPDSAWLLVDGSSPKSARWAFALVLIFLGFACWNIGAIATLVRRVR